MLYFRRVWIKALLLLLLLEIAAKFVVSPISKLLIWVANKQLNTNLIITPSSLLLISNKLSRFASNLTKMSISLFILIVIFLIIWLIWDVFNGQLKLDYYSIELGKHLQRNQANILQMIKSEQEKANYWLKRLRIVKWKHRLYVLIPCGPSAAVEDVIKERCDNYTIGWLNLTIKNSNWINKINEHNGLHFNWLIIKTK